MSGHAVTYFRGGESGPPTRDSTIPRFHTESVKDEVATASAGRPIFKDEERVQFINPGSPHQPVERVTDAHREKWPQQYEAYKRGQDMAVEGTPLEQWPILSRAMVLELKALGLYSIEQCSAMSDIAVQKVGRGGFALREKAKAYLDDAEHSALTERLSRDNEAKELQIAGLQRQVDELKTLMEQMHTHQMQMLNTAPALQSHIPGVHDPMEQMRQGVPMPAAEPSALDRLEVKKRKAA